MYHIIRINYKDDVETHSIEQRETYREAVQRFHNIIAADLGNQSVTYCMTLVLDGGFNFAQPAFVYTQHDQDGDPVNPFDYIVIREFVKSDQLSTSVEYKTYEDAFKRYFNILAADLQDDNITYNCSAIISSDGTIIESKQFFRG